jgi:hypothetical protein
MKSISEILKEKPRLKFRYVSYECFPEEDGGGCLVEGKVTAHNMGAAIDEIRRHLRATDLDGAGWDNLPYDDDGSSTIRIILYREVLSGQDKWHRLGEFECDNRYLNGLK